MRKLLICLAAGAVLAGCGSSGDKPGPNAARFKGDQREVAQVVDRLTDASRSNKPSTICDELFQPAFAQRVGNGVGGCKAEVERKLVDDGAKYTVHAVRVVGDSAVAQVTDRSGDQSLVVLRRADGGWRIARIRIP